MTYVGRSTWCKYISSLCEKWSSRPENVSARSDHCFLFYFDAAALAASRSSESLGSKPFQLELVVSTFSVAPTTSLVSSSPSLAASLEPHLDLILGPHSCLLLLLLLLLRFSFFSASSTLLLLLSRPPDKAVRRRRRMHARFLLL